MVIRVTNARNKTNINALVVLLKKKMPTWLLASQLARRDDSISPAQVTNNDRTNLEFRQACMERGHVSAK